MSILKSQKGFALVIALGLMAFIMLLLLSITAFVRVESQSAATSLHQLEARQNALLGAMVAVGELQRATGPDQRVTATASLVRPATVTDDAELQSHWTGAWIADDPIERKPQLLRWLVSSDDPDALDPLAIANAGNDPLANHVWLVKNAATLNPVSPTADDRSRWVQVPKVQIVQSGGTGGYFAWWVGDHGVKGRVNIGELPATLDPNIAARARLNFQVAQSSGLQGMNTTRYPGLAGWPTTFGTRERFGHLRELSMDTSLGDEIPRNGFHSLTGISIGLLTDTLNGGLRRDLSAGLYDNSQFSAFTNEVGLGLNNDAIYDAADLNGDGNPDPSMGNPGGPLWEQLRSFVNLTENDGSGTDTTHRFRPHRDDAHGLLPVVSRAQVFFYASCYYIPGSDGPVDDIYYQGYRYWILPKVVFWNPYNTRLEVDEETFFRFTNQHTLSDSATVRRDTHMIYARRFRADLAHPSNTVWNNTGLSTHQGGMWVFSNGWNGDGTDGSGLPLTFRIEPFTIEPGEAIVFSPGRNERYRDITSAAKAGANAAANRLVRNPFGTVDYGFYVNVNAGTSATNGLRTINNIGRGAGDESGGGPSRNFARIGVRNATFQNWQWADGADFNRSEYLIGGHYHHWIGNHHRWESPTSDFNISYHFEPPMDGWPSAPEWADTGWGERWRHWERDAYGHVVPRYDENTFANTPLPILYEDQRTTYYNFPDNGFMTHMRFPGSLVNSSQNSNLIERTQWLGQNNPRASFSGRSPNELFFSRTPWFNPNYTDWPIFDWANENNPLRRADVSVNPAGRSYVGHADDATRGGNLRSILFHAPRSGDRFLSIGELSQANLTRHHDFWPAADLHQNVSLFDNDSGRAIPNVYDNLQPAYAIGNSIIDPRVPSDRTFVHWQSFNPTFSGIDSVQYDHSYWLNEALWDRFFFSGIPVGSALPATLPFSRLQYLGNPNDTATADRLRDFRTASSELAVRGALNVNSVSVDAWRVLLTSLYGHAVQTLTGAANNPSQSPFVRSLISGGGPASGSAAVSSDENQTGYRRLNLTEIDALAVAIVEELRERRGPDGESGPFLSLADAINRTPWASDPDHRRMGFLQAALDRTVNQAFINDAATYIDASQATAQYAAEQIEGSAASQIPGYLSQADLLSRIGPALSARSDTFTIRAYGQSRTAVGGRSAGAWCEIVVQRLPDYVNSHADSAEELNPTDPVNRDFGRRYAIVDFRWLGSDDI